MPSLTTLKSNRHILHYEQYGHGPDLIMLHGWGFNHRVWHDLLPLLISHYRVTVLDLPGYGNSIYGNEFSYDIPSIANEVLAIAPAQAIWLGWSLGGMIATYIAAHYPSRVRRLITIASSPCFIETNEWHGMSTSVLDNFFQLLNQDFDKTIKRFISLQFLGCDEAKNLSLNFKEIIANETKPSSEVLAFGLDSLKSVDLREEFKLVQCPILSMFGHLDSLVPRAAVKQIAELNKQCETYVIKKASHAPFYSHPQNVVEKLKNFGLS